MGPRESACFFYDISHNTYLKELKKEQEKIDAEITRLIKEKEEDFKKLKSGSLSKTQLKIRMSERITRMIELREKLNEIGVKYFEKAEKEKE